MRRARLMTVVDILLVCFVVSLVLSMLAQRVYGSAIGWIGIQGDSMTPTIDSGALVLCLPARVDELQIGDIVVFRSGIEPPIVCHRIVALGPDGFLTQGDAVVHVDQGYGLPAINAETLYGYVPQIAGRPVTVPLLGRLTTRGAGGAGQELAIAAGLSIGLLALTPASGRGRQRRR